MPLNKLQTSPPAAGGGDGAASSLLSPVNYDDDASSLHSRSDQEPDSDDDELQLRARNSRELRAADRIVLMEEDEMDRLVVDSRRKQERRLSRRGSGLSVPNPFKMLGRRGSSVSLSSNDDAGRSGGGGSDTYDEKRQARRQRREERRKRLMEDAQDGEDGELMYEMEAGAMKEGSATGESSDREDSDLGEWKKLGGAGMHGGGGGGGGGRTRKQSWRRWILIHSLIAIGFAILVVAAWKLSRNSKSTSQRPAQNKKPEYVSNGTALFAPTSIIISLDGFRADFLQRGLTPRLSAFVKEGVSPKYMTPSFPSVTFPNHYTLATGLYPESHGIVGNTFWDPELEADFYYTDPDRSLDPKWWGGEPFWVTAERQGIRTAVHMWPGSEAHVLGTDPSFLDRFNGKEALDKKAARVLEFLDKPGAEDPGAPLSETRPQLIAAYVPNVDADGHRYGPNSTEIRSTIGDVDAMLDDIFRGLELRNLTAIVNVIVVSDHGMATTSADRLIQLEDLVDASKIHRLDGWPLNGLRLVDPDADLRPTYDALRAAADSNPNFDVYLRDENMPARYHFSANDRIAPLWIVPKTGWVIVTKDEFDIAEEKKKAGDGVADYKPRGLHGYDNEHPLMRAIFVARGPAFPHPAHSEIEVFQNLEVYNMLCDSVHMEPKPNNGTLRLPLKPLGLHRPEDDPDVPPEVDDHALSSSSSSSSSSSTSTSAVAATTSEVTTTTKTSPQRPTLPAEDQNSEVPASSISSSAEQSKPSQDPPPPPPPPSDDEDDEDDDDEEEDEEQGLKGIWKWVKQKVGHVWDKITGSD